MFEIQKAENVKIKPEDNQNRISWPWKDMGIGDMVKISDPIIARKAQVNCYVYGAKSGKKFSAQKIDGAMHVWRTA